MAELFVARRCPAGRLWRKGDVAKVPQSVALARLLPNSEEMICSPEYERVDRGGPYDILIYLRFRANRKNILPFL